MNKLSGWLVVGLLVAALGFAGGWWAKPAQQTTPPLPPLPKEVVVEKMVERLVPGKPQVIERIKLVSKEAPIPEPVIEVIKEQVGGECTLQTYPKARAVFEVEKWIGAGPDGKPAFGWKGSGGCDFTVGDQVIPGPRTELDLRQSSAEIIKEFAPRRPLFKNEAQLLISPDRKDFQVVYSRGVGSRAFGSISVGRAGGGTFFMVGGGLRW